MEAVEQWPFIRGILVAWNIDLEWRLLFQAQPRDFFPRLPGMHTSVACQQDHGESEETHWGECCLAGIQAQVESSWKPLVFIGLES